MVRMGNVWDRAVEVLRGRAGILGPIAALAIFVPAVVGNAANAFVTPGTASASLTAGVVGIVLALVSIWGQLALLAVASDPATTRDDAVRTATARLLPAIGIVLLLGLVFVLAAIPLVLILMRAGVNFAQAGAMQPAALGAMPAGTGGALSLYVLVMVVVCLFVGARLLLLNAVIVNERRGIGSILRSVRLTAGMTWRIVALLLLFAVVLLVPTMAVQAVVGVVARLVLGGDAIATVAFLASSAGAVVTTIFSVIAAAFTAQLYVAAVAEQDGVASNGI